MQHYIRMTNATELLRLINNLIRIGTVTAVDAANVLCTIETGENTVSERPWISLRAGSTKTSSTLSLGEQVILFSPSGDLAQGIVLAGLSSDANPPFLNDGDKQGMLMPDGSSIIYDHVAKALDISLEGQATINIKEGDCTINVAQGDANITASKTTLTSDLTVTGKATFNAAVEVKGKATLADVATTGTLTNNEVNVGSTHTHPTTTEGAPTGVPTP